MGVKIVETRFEVRFPDSQFSDGSGVPPQYRGQALYITFCGNGRVFYKKAGGIGEESLEGSTREYAISQLPPWIRESWFPAR